MAKHFLGSIPLLVLGALVGLLPKVSLGAELTVCHGGCEHSTIQGAVNAAANGDTIFISGGTYSEHVTIQGKSLTIEGSGSNNTFVQGVLDGGPVFTLGAGSGPYYEVDLSYLTVTGGDHTGGTQTGGGIQVRVGAYLHLSNATVTDNFASEGAGIGVMTSDGPPTTLAQCSITGNIATEGGGLYLESGASVDVQQCSISNNSAWASGGGVQADQQSTLTVGGSTVSGNRVPSRCSGSVYVVCNEGYGGGLFVAGDAAVSNSTISGNSVTAADGTWGGGIYVQLRGNVLIARSVIAQNSVHNYGYGGAIYAGDANGIGKLTLDTDYVVLNTAPTLGGIYNNYGDPPLVLNNTTIANNTGSNCSGAGCPPN